MLRRLSQHSCPQLGYALDLYGGNGNATRWNILLVMAAGSAEGGSELADAGGLIDASGVTVTLPLDADLRRVTMRNMYNHDNTRGAVFNMLAGNGFAPTLLGRAAHPILPGADDGAVAFHSSGAIGNGAVNNLGYCWYPPNDPHSGCESLEMKQGSPVGPYHTVYFRDDAQEFSHFVTAPNGGICSQMFLVLKAFAL